MVLNLFGQLHRVTDPAILLSLIHCKVNKNFCKNKIKMQLFFSN